MSAGEGADDTRQRTQKVGARAARNTVVRAAGEIVGKLASLVLFAWLGRVTGEEGLGVYVLAFAIGQLMTVPIELGLDRYLLRRIAADRTRKAELYAVLAVKLTLAVPVSVIGIAIVGAVGYEATVRHAVYVVLAGVYLDSLARTVYSAGLAFERGEVPAYCLAFRGIFAAALGIAALAAGFGVVAVIATYAIAAGCAFLLALVLFARRVGLPPLQRPRAPWRLMRPSVPFAAQEVFGAMFARMDAVILSLLATQAAVGRYGAAYRLLEGTFFISWSINSAFSAMYTYLGEDTVPSVRAVFQRSVKLGLATLIPCAAIFGALAAPVTHAVFGTELDSADPLRILAPVVPLVGLMYLCSSLIVARGAPQVMATIVAGMVAVNVIANLLLIPPYGAEGAALAMLLTEALAVPVALRVAARRVGGLGWTSMLGGPLGAGAAMLAVLLVLAASPLPALAAGLAVYAAVLVAIERMIDPVDLNFAREMASGRLRAMSRRSARRSRSRSRR